jgi:hypothetical protein
VYGKKIILGSTTSRLPVPLILLGGLAHLSVAVAYRQTDSQLLILDCSSALATHTVALPPGVTLRRLFVLSPELWWLEAESGQRYWGLWEGKPKDAPAAGWHYTRFTLARIHVSAPPALAPTTSHYCLFSAVDRNAVITDVSSERLPASVLCSPAAHVQITRSLPQATASALPGSEVEVLSHLRAAPADDLQLRPLHLSFPRMFVNVCRIKEDELGAKDAAQWLEVHFFVGYRFCNIYVCVTLVLIFLLYDLHRADRRWWMSGSEA